MSALLRSLTILVAVGAVAWYLFLAGSVSLKDVEHLTTPRIASKTAQRLLVISHTAATPKEVAAFCFKAVYPAYYKLFGSPKSTPTGRWWQNADDAVKGELGISVPEGTPEAVEMPPNSKGVYLATWEYGDAIAEVLHVGAYSKETPTIERLKAFIAESGYTYEDAHEEEYLRGPGFLLEGNPDEYLTLIRYPVTKAK